jgi:F420-dependent oxidoreductase-like protein
MNGTLRIGLTVAPQRIGIAELKDCWQLADEAGFDSFWVSDHLTTSGDDDPRGEVFEAWALLAAVAVDTSHARIGSLVSSNTYRHPAVLAKTAVTVDHLSGGRLEVGLGAGWAEREHRMLGLDFGTLRDRMNRLEEACQILRQLWTEPTANFAGAHYRLTDAVADPAPLQQSHPPLLIGGTGRTRTLRIAAKYADAWNMPRGTVDEFADLGKLLDEYCVVEDRDPTTLRRSAVLRFADDASELLPLAEAYSAAHADELIVMVSRASQRRGDTVARAEQVAALLPRLRSVA